MTANHDATAAELAGLSRELSIATLAVSRSMRETDATELRKIVHRTGILPAMVNVILNTPVRNVWEAIESEALAREYVPAFRLNWGGVRNIGGL